MRKFYIFKALIILAFIVSSCKDYVETYPVIEKTVSFKYEKVCTLPTHNQSMMLTCFSDKIFIYGCYGLMIYDTTAHSWQRTTFPIDTISGRWDGALSKSGNSLYVFGIPEFSIPKYYNVVKLDIPSLTLEMLPEPLQMKKQDTYPAYTDFNNKAIMLFPHQDSVYVFDTQTQKGRYAAKNIFKTDMHTVSYDVPFIFGKEGNYLYVYEKATRDFRRLNLYTFDWEKIEIPNSILSGFALGAYTNGAVFDGILLLYYGSSKAICYDIRNNDWSFVDYDKAMNFGFESRYTSDNALYILTGLPNEVWKITCIKK